MSAFNLGIRYRTDVWGIVLGILQGAVTFMWELEPEPERDALLLRYPCLYLCNRLQLDRSYGACGLLSLLSLHSACSTLYKACGCRRRTVRY